MKSKKIIKYGDFSLEGILRPNDTVVCGQACAEPMALTRCLVDFATRTGLPLTVFVGTLFSDTFDSAPGNMQFLSYGAIGKASVISDRGLLDVIPADYSQFPNFFSTGAIRSDVVLLQVALDDEGKMSLGLACDYVLDAAKNARVVVAEINNHVPWTYGGPDDLNLRVDYWIESDLPPVQLPPARDDSVAAMIAEHVADLVPNGATLQAGVGSLPDASLRALGSHRHLAIHSGMMCDSAVDLMKRGVIDNSRKVVDGGISVTNTLCGSLQTYQFAHKNRCLEVRHSRITHDAARLAELPDLHAINGALEIDLSGQINCEVIRSRYRGGVGGLLDFVRAARLSQHGRAITLLPSTAAGGGESRIVANLRERPATICRSDVDTVVTEYGVAHLRGATLQERARQLIAIAAPEHRDRLIWEHQQSKP